MRGHLGLIEHVARPCDVTCGVAAILFAGWLDRYPALKLIAPNAGAALPLLREKLDLAQQRAAAGGAAQEPTTPASHQLQEIYVDTATPSDLALAAALAVFGPGRMLFGTDSPPMVPLKMKGLKMMDHIGMSPQQREKVMGGNAARLRP